MVEENIIKNIIREIMRDCSNKGFEIAEPFVKYYVKLLVLDPQWRISSELALSRADVQTFIKYCVQEFEHQNSPILVTLKMQLYFYSYVERIDEISGYFKMELQARLQVLEEEILNEENLEDLDKQSFYKKIIYYITLLSGMGNPTIDAVFKETKAAFGSIFFASDLEEFISYPIAIKKAQLNDISNLVAGIRIFNRDCQKGGVGMEDLPKLLHESIDSSYYDIQRTLSVIMDRVNLMTTALDTVYQIDGDFLDVIHLKCVRPEGVSQEHVDYYKTMLLIYRQYEVYTRKCLIRIEEIENSFEKILISLKETLEKTHSIVAMRTSIPVAQIYPSFIELSNIWQKLQYQTVLLAKLNKVLASLNMYVKQFEIDEQILIKMIGNGIPLTDAERLEETTGCTIPANIASEMNILQATHTNEFDDLHLEYQGFCPWKFVESDGALIPGNPNMGIGHYNNMYFAFSSVAAADAFGKQPETFILKIFEMARKRPQLINFLQVKEYLKKLYNVKKLVILPPPVTITHEVEIQTVTHPIESKIDPNYMWNIWDWKRQALMLADISRRVTHSVQTNKSNWRNPAKAQTTEQRNKKLQTKKDNYTNVPTLSNFIFGLRGRKDDKQFIITLTRPVDECTYDNAYLAKCNR